MKESIILMMESFEKVHRSALQFNQVATEDYLGARRCLISGLIQTGQILACQAIEKILKSLILLVLPNEKFKRSRGYPYHDLEALLTKLIAVSSIELGHFKDLCFRLTKAYHSLRYPDNPHLITYGIFSISTTSIDEVDEMFIYLFEKLKVPDALKCKIGILGLMLINQDAKAQKWFVTSNKAYVKRVNYFSKPLEWWLTDENKREQYPVITILSINDTSCDP